MRFQPIGAPDALHRRLADAANFRHAAATPVGRLRRRCLRHGDNFGFLGSDKGREAPPSRTILIKRLDPAFRKPLPPVQHSRAGGFEFLRQCVVRLPRRRAKNNPRPLRDALLRLASTNNPFKLRPLLGRYFDSWTTRPHATTLTERVILS